MNHKIFAALIGVSLIALPTASWAEGKIALCADINSSSSNKSSYLKDITAGEDGWIFAGLDFPAQGPFDSSLLDAFARLKKALAAKNTELMMVIVPPRGMLAQQNAPTELLRKRKYEQSDAEENYKGRLSQLHKLGIMAPDLFSALSDEADPAKVFFRRDHHWTPYGARLAAKAIAEEIQKRPAYKEMAKSDFSLTEGKVLANEGSIETVAEKACGISIQDEMYSSSTTSAASGGNLLDAVSADIVLVGTSLSNREERDSLNFAGALRHYVKVDVDNRAVAGGGVDASPVTYLQSDDFADAPPKVLIWEMPANYLSSDYEKMTPLFSQLIPQVKGACTEAQALAHGVGKLGDSAILLQSVSGVTPGSDFVYIEASDRGLTEFVLHFKGAQGRDEEIQIVRKTRTANSGRYYVEVPKGLGSALQEINLTTKQKVSGTVTARLCAGSN